MSNKMRVALGLVLLAAGAGGSILLFGTRPSPTSTRVVTKVSVSLTRPQKRPAATTTSSAVSYEALVHQANANAGPVLDTPASFDDAIHLLIDHRVYLDPTGHLWIEDPNAAPPSVTLRRAVEGAPTLVPRIPLYVHWATDSGGAISPTLVCRSATGGVDLISGKASVHWADDTGCIWARALSTPTHVVVPTATGAVALDIGPQTVTPRAVALAGLSAGANAVQLVPDNRGVLAWSPWERDRTGSDGAARFVDGNWVAIDTGVHLLQIVPLLDGSVLELRRDTPGHVSPAIEPLDTTDIDHKHLSELIDKLADDDPEVRDAAYAELSRYGPALWPVLEKSLDTLPPEARVRAVRLLRGKVTPALGGMDLIDGQLETVARQADGTAVFYAPAGVEFPGIGVDPIRAVPAWIPLRPGGRFARPLTPDLVADQTPDHFTLRFIGDDWYSTGPLGPRRYLGRQWVSLLRPDENTFDGIVGADAQGRWVFSSTSAPSRLLVVDPTLLDPTPKLPVWTLRVEGEAGVDHDGWPTIKSGKSVWALHETGWAPISDGAPQPLHPAPVAGDCLLQTADGTRYFDGKASLGIQPSNTPGRTLPLPATAVGDGPVHLIRTDTGMLFLFNTVGRVVRLKPIGNGSEMKVDAVFTRDIPNGSLDRAWLDPAGRIDCIYNGNQLALMFPTGPMPDELAHMQLKN